MSTEVQMQNNLASSSQVPPVKLVPLRPANMNTQEREEALELMLETK